MPECSILIPVFNKWELTRDCLASLHEHTKGHDFEVIVTDNGSTDATARELIPFGNNLFGSRFIAVVFPENRNFAPACNAGARVASSPILFFLNNDTLLTRGWLPPLLEAMSGENAPGAVGPLLLYENDTVQHLGVSYGTLGPLHLYQNFPHNHPVVAKTRHLQSLTGAALMVRMEMFHDCGGFHEEYRNGFEDLDLCAQIRKRNKILRCIHTSTVYHLESQTPGRKDGDSENSRLFTQRCGKDVFIDLHHHAVRDGFAVFITDFLTIGVKLKEADELRLNAQAAGSDALVWLLLAKENPYWIKGREALAHSLEQAGNPNEGAALRLSLTEIEPTISRYKELLDRVPNVTEAEWLPMAERHLATMLQYAKKAAQAENAVQRAWRRMKPGGDPFLEDLLEAKLRAMFPA